MQVLPFRERHKNFSDDSLASFVSDGNEDDEEMNKPMFDSCHRFIIHELKWAKFWIQYIFDETWSAIWVDASLRWNFNRIKEAINV